MTPEERFGMQGELARKQEEKRNAETPPLEQLTAKITKVGTKPLGELVFYLDNGQVWAQNEAGGYLPAKAGDDVTIKPAALKTFWLTLANGRATKVTRVK